MIYLFISLAVIIITFLPVYLWFIFVRWDDKTEPEAIKIMFKCFLLGMGAASIALILNTVSGMFFGSSILDLNTITLPVVIFLLLVGPTEEIVKYFVLKNTAYYSTSFNQVFDGVVYGIMVALGFSLLENIFYLIQFAFIFEDKTFLIFLAISRSTLSTFLHVLCTGIAGYYLGKAKFANFNRKKIIIIGLVWASIIHNSFNLLLTINYFGVIISFILLIIVFFIFMRKWNQNDARMVWRYVAN